MDNSAVLNNEKNMPLKEGKSVFKDIFFWGLVLCVSLIFFKVSFYRYLGPFLACIFAYFYFIKRETILVTTFIVIAHYELKAVLISTVSFPQLMIAFMAYELLIKKKWSATAGEIATVCLAVVMTVLPSLYGSITFEDAFYQMVYIFALYIQYCKYKEDKDYFTGRITLATTVIVSLIAIHTVITGGVEYADMDNVSIIRRGILAAGIGDPNFSCLLLCTGIVSALNCKKIYVWVRIVLIIVMVGAMVVTVSTTGLLALALIAVVHSVISQKLSNKIKNLVIVVLIVIVAVQGYMSLPKQYRNIGVDSYILRMEDKYVALNQQDYAAVTTNRTDLSGRYMKYINEGQSFFKTLFGGNSVVPEVFTSRAISHVTYIDFLLHYGYIGTLLLMLCVLYRFKVLFAYPVTMQYRGYAISLKILYLFFALSISIYRDSIFGLLFFALFIL